MRQRFTGDYPADFPTLDPPLAVGPGEVVDLPDLVPGFEPVDDDGSAQDEHDEHGPGDGDDEHDTGDGDAPPADDDTTTATPEADQPTDPAPAKAARGNRGARR